MYKRMAKYYEEIFPLDQEKILYLRNLLEAPPKSVLDLGCSTGELAYALAGEGYHVTGLDLDEEMINHARAGKISENEEGKRGSVSFLLGDMLQITTTFERNSFDLALCLGNTLVHLPGMTEIREFFHNAYAILKPKGFLVIQILNYARILQFKPERLPTIETENILFSRRYEYSPDEERVEFITTLKDKRTEEIFEKGVTLFCLTPAALSQGLEETGFYLAELQADFSGNTFDENSFSLVAVARKMHR